MEGKRYKNAKVFYKKLNLEMNFCILYQWNLSFVRFKGPKFSLIFFPFFFSLQNKLRLNIEHLYTSFYKYLFWIWFRSGLRHSNSWLSIYLRKPVFFLAVTPRGTQRGINPKDEKKKWRGKNWIQYICQAYFYWNL